MGAQIFQNLGAASKLQAPKSNMNRIHFREPTCIGPLLIKFGHLGDLAS